MTSTATRVPTPKSALRLISTKNLPRQEWLSVRNQGIGSSDAATAAGINPYQSRLELWMIKTGRDEQLPKVDPDDVNSAVYWGNVLEPIVAQQYSVTTGNKVRRINAVLQHPDPDKPWMLANLDYSVVGNEEVQILECKTAGEYGARLWRYGVPDYVQCQVQHQLAVTGKQAADVCVLLCGQALKVHRIHRDEEIISKLIELERQFWHCVETDTPPATDGSESAARALQSLYPHDGGEMVDFREKTEIAEAFASLLGTQARLAQLKTEEAQLKQQIQSAMGEASRALFDQGEVTWKRSKDSVVPDTKRLQDEHPELVAFYTQTRPGSRRFVINTY